MNGGPGHLSAERLLDYWLHDSDAAETEAVDTHLMACDTCGERLDALVALGEGIRAAFRAGTVAAVAGSSFLQRLAGEGLQLREYRVLPGGSVNCSVAPGDQVLVSRLQAPLQGVTRLDALVQVSMAPGAPQRLEDIPFNPQTGEVLFVSKLAEVRQLPAHTLRISLLAVQAGGSLELGAYVFYHQPWVA